MRLGALLRLATFFFFPAFAFGPNKPAKADPFAFG